MLPGPGTVGPPPGAPSLLALDPEHATSATVTTPIQERPRIALTPTNIRESLHVERNRYPRRGRRAATPVADDARPPHLHADTLHFPALSRAHVHRGVPGGRQPAGAAGRRGRASAGGTFPGQRERRARPERSLRATSHAVLARRVGHGPLHRRLCRPRPLALRSLRICERDRSLLV